MRVLRLPRLRKPLAVVGKDSRVRGLNRAPLGDRQPFVSSGELGLGNAKLARREPRPIKLFGIMGNRCVTPIANIGKDSRNGFSNLRRHGGLSAKRGQLVVKLFGASG